MDRLYFVVFKHQGLKEGNKKCISRTSFGYPIKIINTSDMMGEVITELDNIKKANVRDDLFIVPSDYQEIQESQIP